MMTTIILENALARPPQVCMRTGHKFHRMDGSSKVLLVCQTYVTPCLMKSWSVSFGDFHPSGRIGKQL